MLATQNPIEFEGTYPLPEAQLDRFLMRLGVGYPSRDEEQEMLGGGWSGRPTRWSSPVVKGRRCWHAASGRDRACLEPMERYIVDLVRATRATSVSS